MKYYKSDSEKCPECGRSVEYMQISNCSKPIKKDCVCQKEKRENERIERLKRGTVNYKNAMRNSCGLMERHKLMTFESFKPDALQKEAYQKCVSWNPEDNGRGIVLSGNVGCGKTHLLAAIMNKLIDNLEVHEVYADKFAEDENAYRLTSPYLFLSSINLLDGIRKTYNDPDAPDIVSKCKQVNVLFIDDIGAEKPNEWVREQIFSIIDERYNQFRPTLFTTNLTAMELQDKLGARTVDRIRDMCDFITIAAKSHRGKEKQPE